MMNARRRTLIRLCAGLALAPLCAGLPRAGARAAGAASRLTLLGTQGGPNANLQRGETASLLEVDDTAYLVDCGYGTLRALMQTPVSYLTIGSIFLTHLHDDHVADLVALLGHQWTQGRVDPTRVYGPYGTDELVRAALQFQKANTRIRMLDEARTLDPASVFGGSVLAATDTPAQVFSDEHVRVSSVSTTHYPAAMLRELPDRALAYRFDCPDRSIVFSGDTAYSENLVGLARGADVLLCEVMDEGSMERMFTGMLASGKYGDNPQGILHHILNTHCTTEQAGRMASEAGVGTLVMNHILPGNINVEVGDQQYIDGARRFFAGEIVVGRDQMIL